MKKNRGDRIQGFRVAMLLAALFIGERDASAEATTTVDPGRVGSTISDFAVTLTLTDPTIDSVVITFEDMKFLKVADNHLVFAMDQFGSPPQGGNSRSTRIWGFLDKAGSPIYTRTATGVIATAHHSKGTPVAGTFRVYGFFATWDPEVFVRAGTSEVGFSFISGDVTVGGRSIDIKPASENNKVNPRSNKTIWVAILSDTSTDTPFDPLSQINTSTVAFGPEGAAPIRHRVSDVNKDGLGDLLLQFNVRDTGISCGETEAELTAETFASGQFSGTDSIRTVGCE